VSAPAEAVEVVDATGFSGVIGDAAHIYGLAMRRPPELVVQRREIMQSHLQRRGFVAVVARDDPTTDSAAADSAAATLDGFGYGYLGQSGEWWHDVVAGALGRADARRWLRDAFEIAELHVRPERQGHGLGRQLLTRLLGVSPGRTVVLSTHDLESPARALYRSVGFVDLVDGFVFPGSSEVYAVMGLER
jgi:ribosomal protein S18 acetylase RimI-like enzyme